MTPSEAETRDANYLQGKTAAYRSILGTLLREMEIYDEDPQAALHRWRIERLDLIIVLRRVCEAHGDNDWPDNLHLGDVVEKHLERYLES